MLRNVHAAPNEKPGSLTLNRVSLALAVFIKRPQAVPQIGAHRKYHSPPQVVKLHRSHTHRQIQFQLIFVKFQVGFAGTTRVFDPI